jgi:predicted nucleic acid-binding protein
LAGALLLAKELGVVPSLTPILTELERNANFYLRADVRDALLRQAGE